MNRIKTVYLLAGMLLVFSGCNGASVNPPMVGVNPSTNPQLPSGNLMNPIKDVIASAQGVSEKMSMAESLLTAESNPFLVKLPIPQLTFPNPQGDPNVDVVVEDLTASINLLGIIQNENYAMALVSAGDGEVRTEMVSEGQIIPGTGDIKIVDIGSDYIRLRSGNASTSETLSLPSIIGYGANEETNTELIAEDRPSFSDAVNSSPTLNKIGNIAKAANSAEVGNIIKDLTEL